MEKRNLVGEKLKIARLAQSPKASQLDVSARLAMIGISLNAPSISMIENGSRPITDIQVQAFAKVLNIRIAWIFGESEKMKK